MIYIDLIEQIKHLRTRSFSPRSRRRPASGSLLSASRRRLPLGLLAGTLLSGTALAGEAQRQIEQALNQYIGQQLNTEARRQGWQGQRHTLQISRSSAEPRPCSQALQVTSLANNAVLARQRVQVKCPAQPGWSINLQVQATVFLPMVQARQSIERGALIEAEQLKVSEVNLDKHSREFYQDIAEVAGQAAKRRIRAEQVLSPSLLQNAAVIRRGEHVTIHAEHQGISASTRGQALSAGQVGEVIRVRNLASEKIIDAQVLEAGAVSSTFR